MCDCRHRCFRRLTSSYLCHMACQAFRCLVSLYVMGAFNMPSVHAMSGAGNNVPLHGFNVSAGSLEMALRRISDRFSINILAATHDLAAISVPDLILPHEPEAALRDVLAGTGLMLVQVERRTFAVVKPAARSEAGEAAGAAISTPIAAVLPPPILPPEEIVVTGTRSGVRPALDAMAPVDVLSGAMLENQPAEELIDILATLLPGFTAPRRPLSDGQIFVRPASLRGLSPDHMLVFVNGKRRHRTAFLSGGGEQAPELSQIPQLAIGRIEVLRDGASAQYGSDAIAGVVNIILDEEVGLHAFGQYGQYYKGDGDLYRAGVRGGWQWGERGFFVATTEYFNQGMTSRTRQRPDAVEFHASHPEIVLPDPVQNWGQPAGFCLPSIRASIYPIPRSFMPLAVMEKVTAGRTSTGATLIVSVLTTHRPLSRNLTFGISTLQGLLPTLGRKTETLLLPPA